jgi:four helix bundle protein
VPANIAEGYGRENTGSYVHFLRIAQGSVRELQTHLLLAQRLKLGSAEALPDVLNSCETVAKMLSGLIRALTKPDN